MSELGVQSGSYKVEEGSQIAVDVNQEVAKQCRICLDGFQENQEFSPCSCAGSVKYVHQECLKLWINKIIEGSNQKIKKKAHIACELCDSNIYFTTVAKTICNSGSQILTSLKKGPKTFIAFVVLLLVSTGFFLALLDYIINQGITLMQDNINFLVILMICGQTVLSIIFLTIGGLLIKNYLTHKVIIVEDILTNNKIKNSYEINKKSKIKYQIQN